MIFQASHYMLHIDIAAFCCQKLCQPLPSEVPSKVRVSRNKPVYCRISYKIISVSKHSH